MSAQPTGDLANDIVRFIDAQKQRRRLSNNTIESYTQDLRHLSEFACQSQIQRWDHISPKIARRFPAKMRSNGLSGKSIQRMLSSARAFYRFLIEQGEIGFNPFEGVSAPKSAKKLPETLSVDELSVLLATHDGSVPALRDHAILELFYSSGLRLSELATLDVTSIDFGQSQVQVTGKGNKQRIVPVGSKAISALKKWLHNRKAMAHQDEVALFVNQKGKRITTRGIQLRVENWAKEWRSI